MTNGGEYPAATEQVEQHLCTAVATARVDRVCVRIIASTGGGRERVKTRIKRQGGAKGEEDLQDTIFENFPSLQTAGATMMYECTTHARRLPT